MAQTGRWAILLAFLLGIIFGQALLTLYVLAMLRGVV